MNETVLITGIGGQTGSYLADILLEKGFNVKGIVRRNSVSENQSYRIQHLLKDIELKYGDLTDSTSLISAINQFKPQYIFNMAAQSHVKVSYETPQYTLQTTGIGVCNLLEAVLQTNRDIKILQASSSEQFGNNVDEDGFQRETTTMSPVSPYGCAKLMAYSLIRNYRNAYNLFASNSISFNHESPRRGSNFVTSKVVKGAVEIYNGKRSFLEMGNLDSFRDWSHAKDIAEAMYLILQMDVPDDYVIASGDTHSVRELCEYVFKKLGMNYKDFITQSSKYLRPEELHYLKGDSTKFRCASKWKPEYNFYSLLDEMIEVELNK